MEGDMGQTGGRCRTSYSNTGGPPLPQKRAGALSKKSLVHQHLNLDSELVFPCRILTNMLQKLSLNSWNLKRCLETKLGNANLCDLIIDKFLTKLFGQLGRMIGRNSSKCISWKLTVILMESPFYANIFPNLWTFNSKKTFFFSFWLLKIDRNCLCSTMTSPWNEHYIWKYNSTLERKKQRLKRLFLIVWKIEKLWEFC